MTLALTLACLWGLTASVIAMLPMRYHWRAARWLIVTGIPLTGYVSWQNGPWVGLLVLAGGASVLRWPLWYLGREIKRKLSGGR